MLIQLLLVQLMVVQLLEVQLLVVQSLLKEEESFYIWLHLEFRTVCTFSCASDRLSSWSEIGAGNVTLSTLPMVSPV